MWILRIGLTLATCFIALLFVASQPYARPLLTKARQDMRHPASRYAFVVSGSEKYHKMDKNLLVIDIAAALDDSSRGVAALIPVYSKAFAFSSDGRLCLSGNSTTAETALIDAEKAPTSPTESIIAKVPLQAPPTSIAMTRGKPLAFIAESQARIIQVLDLEKATKAPDQAIIATLPLKSPALNLAISPDNAHLLVLDQKLHIYSISRMFIDPEGAEIATISPAFFPASLIFERKPEFLYLSDISGMVLSLFNYRQALALPGKPETAVGRVSLEPNEKFPDKNLPAINTMSLCPGTPYLFMSHPSLDRLSIIDTDKVREGAPLWGLSKVVTGKCPQQISFTAGGEMVLVNNLLSGNIYIYDAQKCVSAPDDALLGKFAIPSPSYLMVKPE
jgi:hypothetical protein